MNRRNRRKEKLEAAVISAKIRWREASAAAVEAAKRAFPIASKVRWKHGRRWRSGLVIGHNHSGFQHFDLRVRSDVSAKEYNVSVHEVIRSLPGWEGW